MAYDQAKADRICELLSHGKSLREASEAEGVSHATVLTWARDNEDFANQYRAAREVGDDVEFESLTDLADEEPERGPDGKVDPGWVTWQRNRVHARMWTLARKRPKKYGDKVQTELTGANGGPVQHEVTKIERVIVDPSAKNGSGT